MSEEYDLNGWIPSSEPPTEPTSCLMIDGGGDMFKGYWDGREFTIESYPAKRVVLYWRPMPKYPTKSGRYERIE